MSATQVPFPVRPRARFRAPLRAPGGTGARRRSPGAVLAGLLAPVGLLALVGLLAGAGATELTWTTADWSGGCYLEAAGIDAEIEPGRLVLENDPADMRWVAEPTHFPGIYTMATFHDTLFLGASYYPLTRDSAEVLAYDYETGACTVLYRPEEQGIAVLRTCGETLYLPGPEPMDMMAGARIHRYEGGAWQNQPRVEAAVHLFDIAVLDTSIYVTAGGRYFEGEVWRSDAAGQAFTRILTLAPTAEEPVRRIYGAGLFQGRLYVQPDGRLPEANCLYAYDGSAWETLAVSGLPVDRQGVFTAWGDSLLLTIHNRLFIYDGVQWHGRWLPFHGYRWCRGVAVYRDTLYGGSEAGDLYRWHGNSDWSLVGRIALDPASEEIEALAPYRGRLYIATSRTEDTLPARLYVSAARPSGSLTSLVQDWGVGTQDATLSWVASCPGSGSGVRFQVRSGATPGGLLASPFRGPDGTTGSYFESSGDPLGAAHQGARYLQYRVELLAPGGLQMPVLESVTVRASPVEPAAIAADAQAISGVHLAAPLPNPAIDRVTLAARGSAGGGGAVELRITDLEGRCLREMTSPLPARWVWDLRDRRGHRVPAGLYWIHARLRAGGESARARPLLVVR